MPGFFIDQGDATTEKNSKAEFRRKHRWRIRDGIVPTLDSSDWTYLQKAARPHYKLDEPVVHHNEEEAWFAGKRHWEPIALTFYDRAKSSGDISGKLWNWIANGASGGSVTSVPNRTTAAPNTYKLDLTLEMLDGLGAADETWAVHNAWAKEVNWNELDYTNTEIQLINVVMRYDRAVRT